MSAAPTQADLLVDIAETRYECWRTPQGEPYVIDREGPSVAVMLRGRGGSLRAELARAFADLYGKVPSSSALTDALTVLHGRCLHAKVQPVHLRLAAAGAGVVVDLGHEDGEVVDITDSGWELVGRCEGIVFRRTEATAPLPFPARGGDLATLRDLLNVSDESWPLLAAWLVAALLPGIPHPVLLLRGEQGTGKSTAARLLGSLVDPSTAPLRTPPANVTDWAVAAAGSWLVALDNVSRIDDWLSDALCKAVTGDGLLRRALYTDDGISVLSFKRVLALTSIDPGALRGDLADRLLPIDLETIPAASRRREEELERVWARARPRVFGALLNLLSDVLALLPHVELAELPRMADFGRVLAAVDAVLGTGGLQTYSGQSAGLADEVVEGHSAARAVRDLVTVPAPRCWEGTAGDLLAALPRPDPVPRDWPANPRAMSAALTRVAPALRQLDPPIEVTHLPRTGRARPWRIDAVGEQPSSASQPTLDGDADDASDGPSPTASIYTGPGAGPCTRCRRPTRLYGDAGSPLCPQCTAERTTT